MRAERIHVPSKPRKQGKIFEFPPPQRERVHEWFRQNLSYLQIRKRIADEFGVSVALSSLSRYYQKNALEFIPRQEKWQSAPNEKPFGSSVHLHFHLHPAREADRRP